jgi:hypothetical protein
MDSYADNENDMFARYLEKQRFANRMGNKHTVELIYKLMLKHNGKIYKYIFNEQNKLFIYISYQTPCFYGDECNTVLVLYGMV